MITETYMAYIRFKSPLFVFPLVSCRESNPIADHHQRVQASGDNQGRVFPSPALSSHRSARSLLDAKGTAFCKDSPARRPGLHAPD